MFNQPFAGGWRFGDRPTSVQALYQPSVIDNDFLKRVATLSQAQQQPQGLLDQALAGKPLDQGLLDGGNDRDQRQDSQFGGYGGGPTVMSDAGNPMTQVSAGGFMPNMANAAKGFAAMGLPGLLGGLIGSKALAPVYDLQIPGFNGLLGNNYGISSSLNGPMTAQTAQNLADQFAQSMMGYQTGGDGFGSAGASFGGAGSFGAGDYGDGTDR